MHAADARFSVAAAFITPVVVSALVTAAASVIEWRLRSEYHRLYEVARAADVFKRGPTDDLTPERLAEMAIWTIDAASLLSGTVGPILGLVILKDEVSRTTALMFVIAVVVAFTGFLYFVIGSQPTEYKPTRPWHPTAVTVVLTLINCGLGTVAVVLA